MDQAHDLLQQEDDASPIAPAERQAAVMELLSQQRFAPATVGELERLHDLWLDLERPEIVQTLQLDRKSTRLNSSHLVISYAVFCLKKKNKTYLIYLC